MAALARQLEMAEPRPAQELGLGRVGCERAAERRRDALALAAPAPSR